MPKSCAARQCCNRYSNRRKQLTFHRVLNWLEPAGSWMTWNRLEFVKRGIGNGNWKKTWKRRSESFQERDGEFDDWRHYGQFPFSRPELLKEWVLNIGRGNFKPKQHTVICSEHFRPECFSAFGNRKNLKHNAVPTVFAFQESTQVLPGAGVDGTVRSKDQAVEELQLPTSAGSPEKEVLPGQPEVMEASSPLASPTGPSDHSYALLDLDALKKKLFLTLKENEKLRKRLRAQRLELRRMWCRLSTRREGRRSPGACARPEQQS